MLHFFNDGPDVPNRFDNVARAGFALGANHGRPFRNAPQGFTQIARAADEGNFKVALRDVVFFIGRCEHFAFIDVIDAKRFENPRFGEMADTRLRHHRDGNRRHDLANLADGRHAGHATFLAYVGRNAFERHHCRGACFFSNQGLLGVDDIHNDAAFQHFGEADL